MLKFKSSVTKLSSAIALVLFSGAASAALVADTTPFPTVSAIPLDEDSWAASYFFISNKTVCSNGCDITGAQLLLDLSGGYNPAESFSNVKLELFSDAGSRFNPVLGESLFTLTNPATVADANSSNGRLGTFVDFGASAQNQNSPALLQPNTGYWLKLTNTGQSTGFGWYFDGVQVNRTDLITTWFDGDDTLSAPGNPLIFKVNGDNSATPRLVPIPGAIWMMGSALIGFTVAGRKKT